jgi:endonuclease YncB( thermonuclease family)
MSVIKFRPRSRFYGWKLGFPGHRSIKYLVVLAGLAVLVAAGFLQTEIETRAPVSTTSVSITVVDGDTVRANGQTYRLVGFDTPEAGALARCERERKLADAASSRLRQLVANGQPALERVACSCPPGTEGTQQCNYGRLCARLLADGRDVGGILISEGLARPYVCGPSGCPRRQSWCG